MNNWRPHPTTPQTAAFTQQDPAAQGPNLYTYVGGNPINYQDPSGEGIFGDILLGLGVVAFVAGSVASLGALEVIALSATTTYALAAGTFSVGAGVLAGTAVCTFQTGC